MATDRPAEGERHFGDGVVRVENTTSGPRAASRLAVLAPAAERYRRLRTLVVGQTVAHERTANWRRRAVVWQLGARCRSS